MMSIFDAEAQKVILATKTKDVRDTKALSSHIYNQTNVN